MLRWLYLFIIQKSIEYECYCQCCIGIPYSLAPGPRDALVKDLKTRVSVQLFWISTIYLADVVFDWLFIEADLKTIEGVPKSLVRTARIFAGIGTLLYILDAFDLVQWVCRDRYRVKPAYVSLANLALEDLPQFGIAVHIAVKFGAERNAIWGVNLATTIFAIVTKLVIWWDSNRDYAFPSMLAVAKDAHHTIEFLEKERMEIDIPKLYELVQDVKHQTEKNRIKLDYKVKTDMPGGVHIVLDYAEKKVTEHKYLTITFEEGSFLDLPQLLSLAVFLNRSKYEAQEKRFWTLDFRGCRIGNPEAGDEPNSLVCSEGSDCIVTLLNLVGLFEIFEEVQIWPDTIQTVILSPMLQPISQHTIEGLCKVLAKNESLKNIVFDNGSSGIPDGRRRPRDGEDAFIFENSAILGAKHNTNIDDLNEIYDENKLKHDATSDYSKEEIDNINKTIDDQKKKVIDEYKTKITDDYTKNIRKKIEDAIEEKKKKGMGSRLESLQWRAGHKTIVYIEMVPDPPKPQPGDAGSVEMTV